MANETEKQAELQKTAAEKTRALEFGLEAGLADLGIDKQAFHEIVGARDDNHFTEIAIEWGKRMSEADKQLFKLKD